MQHKFKSVGHRRPLHRGPSIALGNGIEFQGPVIRLDSGKGTKLKQGDLDVFFEGTYEGAERAVKRVADKLEQAVHFDYSPKLQKWVVWAQASPGHEKVKRHLKREDLRFYSPGVSAGRGTPGGHLVLVHANPFFAG